MGLTDGCRYWSILQVVAIILCNRECSSDITHGTASATGDRSAEYDDSPNNELETPPSENPIQGDAMHSTQGETSGEDDTNYSSPGSEPNHDEEQTTLKGDEIYPNADKQSKGGDPPGPSTEAESSTDVGQTTKAMSEETPIAGIVICCLIILLVISILVVALYQRRKTQQTKSFGPVAKAEVGNRANETDAHATTQGTSHQYGDHPMALYSVIEEAPVVDSEVKQTEAISKDDKSDGVAKDEAKAVVESQTMGLNVYTSVDKPSATASTDSTLEADQVGVKGVADKGDSSPDQVYSLASNDMDSINAKETAVDSSAPQLAAGTVSKPAALQDDGCQTVIENDLYGKADNCAKETAVESSAPQLEAGAVSKPATPQDDGCQTVIENDLYGKADNCAKEIAVESPPSLLLTGL